MPGTDSPTRSTPRTTPCSPRGCAAADAIPAFGRLFVLLNEATPLVEATTAVVGAGDRVPPEVSRTVAGVADAIADGGPPPEPPTPDARASEPIPRPVSEAVESVVATVAARRVPRGAPSAWRPPSPRERVAALWDDVVAGPATWASALRLTLCVAVAEALSELVVIDRSYWVALTVAIVLKPDFGSVFARAVQRAIGTAVGVLVGAGVLALVPLGPATIVFLALFAATLPIAIERNYGLFSIFMTPLILLLIDSVAGGARQLVADRLLDTLLGCGIVLVLGYALWPGSRGPVLSERFAQTVEDVAAYLRRALGAESRAGSSLRRHAHRQLSDLRTVCQQSLAEPPPASTRAAAWWPATLALERVTEATTAAAIRVERDGHAPPPPGGVALLDRALHDLALAVREHRRPRPPWLPEDPLIEGVAAEIRTLVATFSDSPLADQRRRAPRLSDVAWAWVAPGERPGPRGAP